LPAHAHADITVQVLAAQSDGSGEGGGFAFSVVTVRLAGLAHGATHHAWIRLVHASGEDTVQYLGLHTTELVDTLAFDSRNGASQSLVALPRSLNAAEPLFTFRDNKANARLSPSWHLRALVRGAALASVDALRLRLLDVDDAAWEGLGIEFLGGGEGVHLSAAEDSPTSATFARDVSTSAEDAYLYEAKVFALLDGAVQEARVYTSPDVSAAVPVHAASAVVAVDAVDIALRRRLYGAVEAVGGLQSTVESLTLRVVPPLPGAHLPPGTLVIDAVNSVMRLDGDESGVFAHPAASYESNGGTHVTHWYDQRTSEGFYNTGDNPPPEAPTSFFGGVKFNGGQALYISDTSRFNSVSMTAFIAFCPAKGGGHLLANRGYSGDRMYIRTNNVALTTGVSFSYPGHLAPAVGRWPVVAAQVHDMHMRVWMDSEEIGNRGHGGNAGGDGVFRMGRSGYGGGHLHGEIGEVIMAPGGMDTEAVAAVNAYLVAKWGAGLPGSNT
jgi:hypothetical protein